MSANNLPKAQSEVLLKTLQQRFEKNIRRHPGLEWSEVQTRLTEKPGALWSLSEMERTGGEPDVIGYDSGTDEFVFCDCSAESPAGRRNVCYDLEGQRKREKEGLPVAGSVLGMAAEMGIEPLDEDAYRELQKLGSFDVKSQSWLNTPPDIHALGGALFGDRRFNRVFVYHNTAPCFYKVRGFRGSLRV